MQINDQGFQRYAHFRLFPLPGGVKAIKKPRRAALGMLYEIFADKAFDHPTLTFNVQELTLLQTALKQHINCPLTSSAGRLFDAVASLLGLCQINQYEGQAAMALENCAATISSDQSYPFQFSERTPLVINWQVTIQQLLHDIAQYSPAFIAHKFHNTLADIIVAVAQRSSLQNIVLSGGCFQNALLVEKTVSKLNTAGFQVYSHEKIPPNDGGLALGQLLAAKYLR